MVVVHNKHKCCYCKNNISEKERENSFSKLSRIIHTSCYYQERSLKALKGEKVKDLVNMGSFIEAKNNDELALRCAYIENYIKDDTITRVRTGIKPETC